MSTIKEQIARKADSVIADFTANGGLLNAEQSNLFLRTLLVEPSMLQRVRVVQMRSPEVEINKIGFGQRIMRAATENAGLAVGERSVPTTSKLTLVSKEAIAEVRLPYQVIEDVIEEAALQFGTVEKMPQGQFMDTILTLVAQRALVDIEDAMLNGDTARVAQPGETAGEHAYMSQHDGWLKQALASHVVDFAGAKINRSLLKKALQVLPVQYLRDRSNMAFFVNHVQEIEYQDTLAGRETSMGDSKHNEAMPARAAGALVVPVGLMPQDQGIFCNPKNLIFGIRREMSMEFAKDISARQWIVVVTVRMCPRIEWDDAVVALDNIGAVI